MKRDLKMNPNVAGNAELTGVTTAMAAELHARCLMPYVPDVELKPKFLLSP